MRGSIPGFPVLFHLFICLSICQTTVSWLLIAHRKSWNQVMWILHHFLLENFFGYSRPFAFPYTFQISVSVSTKLCWKKNLENFFLQNYVGKIIFMFKNTVNLYIKLERLNIFIVSLSLWELDVPLHYLSLFFSTIFCSFQHMALTYVLLKFFLSI